MSIIHQMNTIAAVPFIQETLARLFQVELQRLNRPDSFFTQLSHFLEQKQIQTMNALDDLNINYVYGDSNVYILMDIRQFAPCMDPPPNNKMPLDVQISHWLSSNKVLFISRI